MNRRVFILIIIIMTLALVGLMMIQSYWIRNTITVKEANFIQSVNEALTTVIYKLERIEAANQLSQEHNFLQQRDKWLLSMDSLNRMMFEDQSGMANAWDLNRFFQKSLIAQDVLESMMNNYRNLPIENRINISVLDSLITTELKIRGIETNYEFGVFSPARNFMPIQKTGKFPKELLNKGFSFALFPSDVMRNPDYLMLYFPNERRFLITQLWRTLSVSLAFVIIIILSFTYTLLTIFKQKKISEMKNDFINNMTHEIKTPISTIALACEALGDKDIIKSETLYQNYINVINEENSRLGSLTERILQSAKLEKGEIILKKEEVDIHEIIREAVNNIYLQVEKKGGHITKRLMAESNVLSSTGCIFQMCCSICWIMPINIQPKARSLKLSPKTV
ncbi:MAG: histidine kinase dimerization/phospho-acceptor domain-containing protein [Bacteroidales bacterium]